MLYACYDKPETSGKQTKMDGQFVDITDIQALSRIPLSLIDPNPMRRLKEYPYNEQKIIDLRASIRDVGFWAGVIARPDPSGNGRYQLAFGHHRTEAARREFGPTALIDIMIRDLSDEQMLKFMVRENMDTYGNEFMNSLEAWTSASEFLFGTSNLPNGKHIDVAKFLGWMRSRNNKYSNNLCMTDRAETCFYVQRSIQTSMIDRDDYVGVTAAQAREIARSLLTGMKRVDQILSTNQKINKQKALERMSQAAKNIVKEIRQTGDKSTTDIRGRIMAGSTSDIAVLKGLPGLAQAAQVTAEKVKAFLSGKASDKRYRLVGEIKDIATVRDKISEREDIWALHVLARELYALSDRAKKLAESVDPKTNGKKPMKPKTTILLNYQPETQRGKNRKD